MNIKNKKYITDNELFEYMLKEEICEPPLDGKIISVVLGSIVTIIGKDEGGYYMGTSDYDDVRKEEIYRTQKNFAITREEAGDLKYLNDRGFTSIDVLRMGITEAKKRASGLI